MSYLGYDFVTPARPDCHSSLSGILFEERSWTSQDDRESEGLPTDPDIAGTRAGVTEKETDCGGHLLCRNH
jgi:hypothetical protein